MKLFELASKLRRSMEMYADGEELRGRIHEVRLVRSQLNWFSRVEIGVGEERIGLNELTEFLENNSLTLSQYRDVFQQVAFLEEELLTEVESLREYFDRFADYE